MKHTGETRAFRRLHEQATSPLMHQTAAVVNSVDRKVGVIRARTDFPPSDLGASDDRPLPLPQTQLECSQPGTRRGLGAADSLNQLNRPRRQ